MTYNSALADELIGVIEGHPRQHNQGMWVLSSRIRDGWRGLSVKDARMDCGTVACVAGWTAILTLAEDWVLFLDRVEDPAGKVWRYTDLARDRLGLTGGQAAWLFRGYRTRDEVLWALKWLRDHPDADGKDLNAGYANEWA